MKRKRGEKRSDYKSEPMPLAELLGRICKVSGQHSFSHGYDAGYADGYKDALRKARKNGHDVGYKKGHKDALMEVQEGAAKTLTNITGVTDPLHLEDT